MESEGYGVLWAGESVEEMGLKNVLYQSYPLFDSALAYIRRHGEYVTKYDRHTFVVSTDMHHVEKLLLETNIESEVLFFDAAKDCMDAVLNGQAEMTILSDQVAEYWLQKPLYADKLVRVSGSGAYVYGVRLYVPKQHQHLINILNKTLNQMSETQKLYMVDNAAMAHSYDFQLQDVIYRYSNWLMVTTVLSLITIGMIIHTIRFRFKLQKKEAKKLRKRLQTDELTGTYSKAYFWEKAEEMIHEEPWLWNIVRVNICYFKLINELCGVEEGDKLLQNIGIRLSELAGKHGFIVSRFTSDRFYLLMIIAI